MKSPWHYLYGPLKVLDNEDDVRASGFDNERLKDLEKCGSIKELELEKGKETIDLTLIPETLSLRELTLRKVAYTNFSHLKKIQGLKRIHLENCELHTRSLEGFDQLESLLLWRVKIHGALSNLGLHSINWLWINECKLEDFSFLDQLPKLRSLYINHNSLKTLDGFPEFLPVEELLLDGNPDLKDISKLSKYSNLERVDIMGTAVKDLRPLMMLPKLRRLNAETETLAMAKEEYGFVEPKESVPDGSWWEPIGAILDKIKCQLWDEVYDLPLTDHFSSALGSLFVKRMDSETIGRLLDHPSVDVFNQVVIAGLDSHLSITARAFEEQLVLRQEKIKQALIKGFAYHLDQPDLLDTFYVGKLKRPHHMIARLMGSVNQENFVEIYKLFFSEAAGFSASHHSIYKILCDSAPKTNCCELVEPILNLISCEDKIVGGDNVFVKKIFKAVGSLGSKNDIALVIRYFRVENEKRSDVVLEYEKMIRKLERKVQ